MARLTMIPSKVAEEQRVSENRNVLDRPAPGPDLTLRYGPEPDQVMDVRLPPDGSRPAPVLVLWHGGYWRAEWDRTHIGPMAHDLARRGYVVVTPEYRRTGEGGGWPTTFADVAASVDALPRLLEDAAPGRADLARIGYAGHSAGGHLAVWATLRHRLPAGSPGQTTEPPRVTGVLALAPVLDLAGAYRRDLDDGAVRALLGGGPAELPERYAATDPMAIGVPETPVLLVFGDRDNRVPVEMFHEYHAVTGCPFVELADADHFAVIDPTASVWPQIVDALHTVLPLDT